MNNPLPNEITIDRLKEYEDEQFHSGASLAALLIIVETSLSKMGQAPLMEDLIKGLYRVQLLDLYNSHMINKAENN